MTSTLKEITLKVQSVELLRPCSIKYSYYQMSTDPHSDAIDFIDRHLKSSRFNSINKHNCITRPGRITGTPISSDPGAICKARNVRIEKSEWINLPIENRIYKREHYPLLMVDKKTSSCCKNSTAISQVCFIPNSCNA